MMAHANAMPRPTHTRKALAKSRAALHERLERRRLDAETAARRAAIGCQTPALLAELQSAAAARQPGRARRHMQRRIDAALAAQSKRT